MIFSNIVKFGYIDSALIVKSFNHKILNLNDSPLNKDSEIYQFKKKYVTFDTLLTQFSYAAWKGGKNNYNFREQAALEKLETIKKQTNILECSSVIPFASFIYFSNEMNKYMNDNINNPEDVYKEMINEKTSMISIMHAHNEIGVIQPIEEIGNLCDKLGILFHVDAAQSTGKIPIDVNKMKIDLLSMSSHKMYGPKGVGALFIKRKIPKIAI